jgi:hypothetical protein
MLLLNAIDWAMVSLRIIWPLLWELCCMT